MRDFDSDGNRLLLPLGASKLAEDAYLSLLLEQDLNIPDDVIDELLDLNLVALGRTAWFRSLLLRFCRRLWIRSLLKLRN